MISQKKTYSEKEDSINELPSPTPQDKHNLLVLKDIAERIADCPYGNITFTLRIHNGYVTDIVNQTNRRKRYQMPK